MALKYSLSSYDDNLCLKPPVLLQLAVIYLSRAFVLLVIYDLAPFARISPDAVAMLRGTVSLYALIPSLIAAPVLFALVRRAPAATMPVRWIWSHGRIILTAAAILDFAVSIAGSGIARGDFADLQPVLLLAAAYDIYFLVYLFATPRVRDVFADFPPHEPPRRRRRA